jgi:hypothetical protein
MLSAVDFHDKARRLAAEVGHLGRKGELSAELGAVHLIGAELRP